MIIIMTLVVCGLVAMLHGVVRMAMMKNTLELEQKDITLNLQQALDAIFNDIHAIDTVNADWAYWDDTYQFIQNKNEGYIQSNLSDSTLKTLRLNLMIFLGASGDIVYAKGFDLENNRERSLSPNIAQAILSYVSALDFSDPTQGISGIISLPQEGPLLISIRPVLTSALRGPSPGMLIFGRWLDSSEIQYLSEITHLSLGVYPFDSPSLPDDFALVKTKFIKSPSFYFQPFNGNIAGYAAIDDLLGRPTLLMRVDKPRDIFHQGEAALIYASAMVAAVGALFLVITLIVLGRIVISPLVHLHHAIQKVSTSGDLALRVSVAGKDELSSLVQEFNRMLKSIQSYQREVQENELKLRTLFENTISPIFILNQDGQFIEMNNAALGFFEVDRQTALTQTIDDYLPVRFETLSWKKEEGFELNFSVNGKIKTLLLNLLPLTFNGNSSLYGIGQDITPQKNIERQLASEKERLTITLKSIGDGVIVTDQEGAVTLMNSVAESLTGWSQDQAEHKFLREIFHLVDELTGEEVEDPVQKVLRTGQMVDLGNHTVLISHDGSRHLLADSASPIRNEDQNLIGVIVVFRDVTEVRQAEKALRESEERYRNLVNTQAEGVSIVDEHETFLFANPAAHEIFGVPEGQLIGRNLREFTDSINLDIMTSQTQLHRTGVKNSYEVNIFRRDGQRRSLRVMATPWFDDQGKYVATFGVFQDITEQKQYEEQIKFLSFHDKLTGLYNRAYFDEECKRLDTERQLPLSCIMGDINNLKTINDAFGHDMGDSYLCMIADILRESCRKEDIIARWGGDEFIILLPRTSPETAIEICERIRQLCSECVRYPIPVSIALGTATKINISDDFKTLLREAEDRMYRNKLLESASSRHALISSLERSLWEIDYMTEEHARRTQDLARRIGRSLKISQNLLDDLVLLAALHDIGKIAIPKDILTKPDDLLLEEWSIIKKHPEIGYRIAKSSPELFPIADAILAHHEWWDGSGYPQGLKGEEIPLISRIIAIIDAYDVLTHDRPYKKRVSEETALNELKRCAGTQFDPELVEIFIQEMKNPGIFMAGDASESRGEARGGGLSSNDE